VTTLDATSRRPIAVVGATGQQGGATRPRAAGREHPGPGIGCATPIRGGACPGQARADLVAADLDDPEGLRAAFTGVRGVFAMTTPGYDQRTDIEVRHGTRSADAQRPPASRTWSTARWAVRNATPDSPFRQQTRSRGTTSPRGAVHHLRPTGVLHGTTSPSSSHPAVEDGTLVVRLPLPAGIHSR